MLTWIVSLISFIQSCFSPSAFSAVSLWSVPLLLSHCCAWLPGLLGFSSINQSNSILNQLPMDLNYWAWYLYRLLVIDSNEICHCPCLCVVHPSTFHSLFSILVSTMLQPVSWLVLGHLGSVLFSYCHYCYSNHQIWCILCRARRCPSSSGSYSSTF